MLLAWRPCTPAHLFTHLFEAEGHREHAHSDDAVHHVHDEAPVGRRHLSRSPSAALAGGESGPGAGAGYPVPGAETRVLLF